MAGHYAQSRAFSLILRRMRAPLIMLIIAYAVSVLGFVLIPGIDDQGQPWQMGFFHAFYVVSYTATTIGFGELPYPFTDGQRFWALATVYITVISWLYAIGTILTLVQDPALKRTLIENRFANNVRHLRQPFYIVCGYGDTGTQVVNTLTQRNIQAVVVDIRQGRIDELLLDELRIYVPGLCADAGDPHILRTAGLNSPYCMGLLALTDDDHSNLEVAITSKLLNPNLRIICRAETKDTQANMASFGTDHIINPYEAFAEQLAIALHSPAMHLIYEWLTQPPHTALFACEEPPHGLWIICGYGRFGKAMERYLKFEGISTIIIEADPEKTGCEDHCIKGRGTEAVTLRTADIDKAVGIIAGTDDDANNLSILMTAKDLNPNIYTVVRQNRRSNSVIFDAADTNMVMQYSIILSLKIQALLTSPLLSDFLRLARRHNNSWAEALTRKLRSLANNKAPDIWTVSIDAATSPTLIEAINQGEDMRLGHLTSDPRHQQSQLHCLPLLLKRGDDFMLLPQVEDPIQSGDQILFCGREECSRLMEWTRQNYNTLRYIITGENRPDGHIWRWLAKQRQGVISRHQ